MVFGICTHIRTMFVNILNFFIDILGGKFEVNPCIVNESRNMITLSDTMM